MVKVIGITGTIASGKEEVREILKKRFSAYYVTLSDVIRSELERKKINFTRKTLQDHGNEMRKQYGNHILALLSVEYLPRDKQLIIIDGIRNPGEAEYLGKKFGPNFILIGVDAPKEIRWQRVQQRKLKTDPKTFEEFDALDNRDQGIGEPLYGQQVKACIDKANAVIENNGSLEDLEKKVDEVSKQIIDI